jgi:hypothetical protein
MLLQPRLPSVSCVAVVSKGHDVWSSQICVYSITRIENTGRTVSVNPADIKRRRWSVVCVAAAAA